MIRKTILTEDPARDQKPGQPIDKPPIREHEEIMPDCEPLTTDEEEQEEGQGCELK